MRRRLLVSVAVYVFLATVVWFYFGGVNLPFLQRLAANGVPTEASVTFPDCGNHNNVRYTFEANGRTFSGGGRPGRDRPCNQLRVGDRLTVWYVPADPSINLPRNPKRALANELLSLGLAAVVMPAVVVWRFIWRGWRRRSITA